MSLDPAWFHEVLLKRNCPQSCLWRRFMHKHNVGGMAARCRHEGFVPSCHSCGFYYRFFTSCVPNKLPERYLRRILHWECHLSWDTAHFHFTRQFTAMMTLTERFKAVKCSKWWHRWYPLTYIIIGDLFKGLNVCFILLRQNKEPKQWYSPQFSDGQPQDGACREMVRWLFKLTVLNSHKHYLIKV